MSREVGLIKMLTFATHSCLTCLRSESASEATGIVFPADGKNRRLAGGRRRQFTCGPRLIATPNSGSRDHWLAVGLSDLTFYGLQRR